jgi:hypothetical protein
MGYVLAILAIVSAVGTLYTGQQQQKAAKYNEDVNKKNAETAQQQAMFDAEQIRAQNRKLLGAQRAAASASGVDPDGGSMLDVQQDSAAQGELEALTAIYTGRGSANTSYARAALNRMEGKAARTGSYIGATQSLLGGATQSYGAFTKQPTMGQ